MVIKTAVTQQDIIRCEKVILELRPHLKGKSIWNYYQTQQLENYSILFIEADNEAASFIGYRTQTMFYSGKTIYIDDLCSLPAYRGKGYAGLLLDHILNMAKAGGYDTVSLDSGHHRHDAHRLYLNKGYNIASHHFQISIK